MVRHSDQIRIQSNHMSDIFLFILGPLVRKSVECYNPDRDEWTAVSEMNNCRRNAGVITNGGLLYVIGGDDGTSNLQSVEVYNPKTDIWTVLNASMSLGRSYTGVCIIDKPDSI